MAGTLVSVIVKYFDPLGLGFLNSLRMIFIPSRHSGSGHCEHFVILFKLNLAKSFQLKRFSLKISCSVVWGKAERDGFWGEGELHQGETIKRVPRM